MPRMPATPSPATGPRSLAPPPARGPTGPGTATSPTRAARSAALLSPPAHPPSTAAAATSPPLPSPPPGSPPSPPGITRRWHKRPRATAAGRSCAEATGRQAIRLQAVFQLPDRLLRNRPTTHVEVPVDRLGMIRQVGHHETSLTALRRPLHLGHDATGVGPTLGLVVADLLEALHERIASTVEGVVQLHVGQGRGRGPLQHGIARVADGIRQPLLLAEVVDGRHAEAVVRPHPDDHVWPGGAESGDQGGQDFHGPATGVDRPRPQPGRQGKPLTPSSTNSGKY